MEVLNLSTVPNSDDETESEKNEGHVPSDKYDDDNTNESESLGEMKIAYHLISRILVTERITQVVS